MLMRSHSFSIAQYKAQEDEEAAQELREQNRRSRDHHQHESELDTLRNNNEQLRELLDEETKKSERLIRDRDRVAKNLAEAESGARRQGAELSNREGTITRLTDQLDKVTKDSIKKSTTIQQEGHQGRGAAYSTDWTAEQTGRAGCSSSRSGERERVRTGQLARTAQHQLR